MDEMTKAERATKIAKLNDAFRRSGIDFGFTPGAQALKDREGLIEDIKRFDRFAEQFYDPCDHHDFGIIRWHGERVFWKIEYRAPALQGWRDPLDADCYRTMTVMVASEYYIR